MPLVAYLTTLGRRHIDMELDRDPTSCYWVFDVDGELPDIILSYLEGRATVEPKGFNNIMSYLKNNMFDFLRLHGIDTSPNRR